jgi:uncharacterized protein (TIGR03435 family)
MQRTSTVLGVCLGAAAIACAQASFEVASIKPHPGVITMSADPWVKGDRVESTASTLRDLITSAYRVRYDQLEGGPAWIATEHYDLQAKVPGNREATMDEVRPMLQTLLAERFHLRIRHETREVAMFALVVAKGGPKFKESADAEQRMGRITGTNTGMQMTIAKGTMAELATRLSGNGAGRPVTDRTGLKGRYTFELRWTNRDPEPDSDIRTLFTALQEQLGLKLEPIKGPGEILVIESAEKPSAN